MSNEVPVEFLALDEYDLVDEYDFYVAAQGDSRTGMPGILRVFMDKDKAVQYIKNRIENCCSLRGIENLYDESDCSYLDVFKYAFENSIFFLGACNDTLPTEWLKLYRLTK